MSTITLARENVSINVVSKIETIMNAPKGGFMSIRNFRPKYGKGEVKDITFCKGISYENAVARSLVILEEMEDNSDLEVTVKRGVWADVNGNSNPTNRRSKLYPNFKLVTETYKRGDGVMEEALASIRKSLTNPAPANKDYTKVGNGVYVDEVGAIHIRDLRKVSQKVHTEGDYPNKATSAKVAVADKLKSEMPISNYRQFRLDGDYDMIKVGGSEITHDVTGEVETD